MRISRTLVGVIAVGLLTAGCGSSDDDDADATPSVSADGADASKDSAIGADGEVAGSELPHEVEEPEEDLLGPSPELSPSPERGSATENVLNELKVGTLKMARVHGKMDAKCSGGALTLKAGATTKCTVTYEGVDVPWNVTISDNYKSGSTVFSYQAEPEKGVLTARAAYGQWHKLQSAENRDELRCSEIPDVELVDLDTPTNYKCQYLMEKDDGDEWSDRVIAVKTGGVEFNLP